MQLPFLGPTYQSRSLNANASRCVNFYPEMTAAQDDKTPMILVGTPGTLIKSMITASTNAVRAIYSFNNKLFCIAQDKFYSVDINAGLIEYTELGELDTSSGRVSIADNGVSAEGIGGDQIIIVDGTSGYIYNDSTEDFSKISDADFISTPTQVAYIDGYFVVSNDTMRFNVSDMYDGTSWNALAVAAVTGNPDSIQAVTVQNNQLFFIKEYSSEVWYNTGTPTAEGSPFTRVSGAVYDYGTPAKWSVARGAGSIFFIATNRTNVSGSTVGVVQVTSYEPQVISPPPISYRISQSTDISQIFGFCYSDQGHMFYVLTSPADDWTFVYDTSTQMWHERSSYDDGVTTKRHLSNCYAYYNGKHYVGDYRQPYISEMSGNYVSDTGNNINSFRTTQHTYDPNLLSNVFISKLIVDVESGVGQLNPPVLLIAFPANGTIYANGSATAGAVFQGAIDPQIDLSWSDDAGHTYGSSYSVALGNDNEYSKRAIWRRLGRSRSRVWKIAISDPVKKIILGAYAEVGL